MFVTNEKPPQSEQNFTRLKGGNQDTVKRKRKRKREKKEKKKSNQKKKKKEKIKRKRERELPPIPQRGESK